MKATTKEIIIAYRHGLINSQERDVLIRIARKEKGVANFTSYHINN